MKLIKIFPKKQKKILFYFTTKFHLEELNNKIKTFFEKINFSINKKDKNHFDILNKNKHFISIELSKLEKNSIVNI